MKTRNIILGMLLFAFSACTPENKSVTELFDNLFTLG